MRRFNRVGARAFEPVRIVGGARTRAIIQRPADQDRPGVEFVYENLTCRVLPNSLMTSGQVIIPPDGQHYLVADHSSTVDWVTHHLFRCSRQVTWQRSGLGVDTLTGLTKAQGSPTTLGTPWVLWQRVRREITDLTIRIDQEAHLVATGVDVQPEDTLNGLRVKRVEIALGVRVVELHS